MHSLNPFVHDTDQESDAFKQKELRPGEFWALQDINFEVRRGECLGLIGHNGAGKSTLLKILNSLLRPDTGRITMKGRVGALIELSAGFNPILSGRENIYNQAALLGFTKQETDKKYDEIVNFSELEQFLEMPLQNYSSGMRVRLGFAVAVNLKPDILIIDEVLAVGDAAFRFKCINAMADILENSAVVFVSHSMPQVFRVSTSAMVLDHGNVLYLGSDVGRGINEYYESQLNPEGHITGSGDATVTQVTVTSENHVASIGESISVDPENGFGIEMSISLSDGIDDVCVQAVIWNQEMIPVVEIVANKGAGYTILADRQPGPIRLCVNVPPLHLNGGKHMLTICVVSPDYKRVYCRHDNAAILNISNANVSGAACIRTAKWSVAQKLTDSASHIEKSIR